MKARHYFFLPLFLCFTLLFRMCFLSFGPVKHTVIPFRNFACIKSKSVNVKIKKRQIFTEHSNTAFNSVSKLKISKRGVLNRKLKLPLLSFISSGGFLKIVRPRISRTCLPAFTENIFLSSQKSEASSILRI